MAVERLPPVSVHMPVRVARYQPGAVFGPRQLPDYELFWILTGRATRAFETPWGTTERNVLRPGLLNLSAMGTVDTHTYDTAGVSTHAFVHFDLDELQEVAPGGRFGPAHSWPSVVDLRTSPVLTALCQYTLDLAVELSSSGLERTQHCIALMLDLIVRGPASTGPRTDPRLEALVEHVAASWAREGMGIISGDRLARAVGLSRGHLQLLMSRRFGCGPARMLEMVRLAHAAVTLQRSNATVAEVSSQCGFANPYHFSRRFKQLYGEPPSTFRYNEDPTDPYGPLREHQLLRVAHRLLQVRTWD